MFLHFRKTNQGFVRSFRLQRAEDFKQVFQLGDKHNQGGILLYTRLNGLGYSRLGLAIAKKVIQNASARNQVKRLIRESFRLNQRRLPGVDIVVVVTSRAMYNNRLLLFDLDKQWSRLEVYYKKA